jgi:uncharacterized protein (TIGR03083 family)
MADDLVEVHGRCGRRFAALVAGVGPGQWHDGTPCSQWDVRTLVHHLLSEQRWVPPMFEGLTIEQVGDRFEGDLMGGDASKWPGLVASAMEEAPLRGAVTARSHVGQVGRPRRRRPADRGRRGGGVLPPAGRSHRRSAAQSYRPTFQQFADVTRATSEGECGLGR